MDEPIVVRDDVLKSATMSDESDLVQDDVQEHKEEAKLPLNKAEYMKMSVAEKVRCYPFDTKGTDAAFEMVKKYFETVGLGTDFSSVYEEAKLLTECYEKQKADYMRMSVAEKVRCYPFDDKGKDAAFEMVRTYFEKIGMDTSFDSVYEETKLLTDYYEKQKAEEFIQEKTEQIIGVIKLLGLDASNLAGYSMLFSTLNDAPFLTLNSVITA